MKTNLGLILWKKEKIHWKRIKEMFTKFNNWLSKLTFGIIVAILIIIAHYAFAIMHTLYEIFLWVFYRKAFRANLQKLIIRM